MMVKSKCPKLYNLSLEVFLKGDFLELKINQRNKMSKT